MLYTQPQGIWILTTDEHKRPSRFRSL